MLVSTEPFLLERYLWTRWKGLDRHEDWKTDKFLLQDIDIIP